MKFGVLGTGQVGQALAHRLVQLGHDVCMGGRSSNNEKALAFARSNPPKTTNGTFADAAEVGEVLLNCTSGAASLEALSLAGEKNLAGKTLIDIANPLDFTKGMPPSLLTPSTDSLAEQIQRAHPQAKVVKALNTVNCSLMVEPKKLASGNHDVFLCGNDKGSKGQVTELLQSFGWKNIVDLGELRAARGMETYLLLWVTMYGTFQTPEFNIKYRSLTAMAFIDFQPEGFRRLYNRQPFRFRHNLAEHPMMQLESLKALALRMSPADVLHRHAKVPVNTDFDHAHENHSSGLTLKQTLDQLEECNGYICINTPEKDALFRPFVEEVLAEVRAQTEPIDPGLYWHATYVFISAQGSVTPYHMDREMNFLMQMRGRKEVLLWDPLVMSAPEREKLMTDFHSARPQFREELRAKAQRYEIGPGDGVHHPFIAPHLVTNGPSLSVSWAFTFRTRGSDRKGNVLKVNHYLRKLGLEPKPEGEWGLRDRVKDRSYLALQPLVARARSLLR